MTRTVQPRSTFGRLASPRMQSSLLVIAEVQPVLVFEDKDTMHFSSFQEITQILPQLLATITPKSDKELFLLKILSQLSTFLHFIKQKKDYYLRKIINSLRFLGAFRKISYLCHIVHNWTMTLRVRQSDLNVTLLI